MKNNKKGFTLVELIVVITILAILGTVAFLSLQSYASFARNAIRLDGISKIATIVAIKKQAGIASLSFVNPGQEVPSAQIGGTTAIVGTDYQAGTINTTALEIKNEDFIDPTNGQLFRIGATTKKGDQYEVVATLEESGGQRAKISGSYEKRNNGTLTGTGILGEKTFLLADQNDLNKLFKSDIVIGTGVGPNTRVIKISDDGLTITLNNDFTAFSNGIQLGSEETDGLILSTDASTPVTNDSTDVAYEIKSTP